MKLTNVEHKMLKEVASNMPYIKQTYTLKQILAQFSLMDYNSELLLQHLIKRIWLNMEGKQ